MSGIPDRLERILRDVRARAAARRAERPLAALRAAARPDARRRERFVAALRGARGGFGLIAECKRRSPSAGALDARTPPAERAAAYARGGADALSVLTEADHFGGGPEDLAAVAGAGLPRLRKDFLLDEGMVLESAEFGADAVLLIAEALPGSALAELRACAGEAGLAVLIEAHGEEQLDRALAAAPDCVGVNARDLRDFRVDAARAAALLGRVPDRFVRVAESGLETCADLLRARAAGADAALVGTALMRAADPEALLRGWRTLLAPPRVKVCGITSAEDARAALAAGADALGVVLAPSRRRVDPARAAEIVRAAAGAPVAGVFVDAPRDAVAAAVARAGLAAVQLCGAERPEDFAGLPFPVWRRVPCEAGAGAAEIARWRGVAALFVLDHPSGPGGTGRAVAPEAARSLAALAPCLLAGGLGPDNVAALAAAARPHGVDASSRLESAPGRKDPLVVKEFVAAARAALAGEAVIG